MNTGVTEADGDTGLMIADPLPWFRERGKFRAAWVGPDGSESVVYPTFPSPVE